MVLGVALNSVMLAWLLGVSLNLGIIWTAYWWDHCIETYIHYIRSWHFFRGEEQNNSTRTNSYRASSTVVSKPFPDVTPQHLAMHEDLQNVLPR